MANVEGVLAQYGLWAVFVLLLVKSVGVPVPVPADVLMLWVSVRVAEGKVVLWEAFLLLLLAFIVGSLGQFWLARGPGRGFLNRYGPWIGLTSPRLEQAASVLRRTGLLGVALSSLTPGVRAVNVAAAGLADLPLRVFVPGLTLGSSAFLALHFGLGYAGGALLNGPLRDVPLPWLVGGALGALTLSLGVWVLLRRRGRPGAHPWQGVGVAVGAWHEAACPACLVLAYAEQPLVDRGWTAEAAT